MPEKRDAVTPDLPPVGPSAPDRPDAMAGRPRRDGPEKGRSEEEVEQPAPGPGNAKPQEPTD
ncbi:hypothetical protein [Streptomyces sp. NBC_00354]|uniref:hypothetical protein n=1 Tax=Streptomyces sp. NBC_00354 TaxID=2975723 RepID=UPI002E26750D